MDFSGDFSSKNSRGWWWDSSVQPWPLAPPLFLSFLVSSGFSSLPSLTKLPLAHILIFILSPSKPISRFSPFCPDFPPVSFFFFLLKSCSFLSSPKPLLALSLFFLTQPAAHQILLHTLPQPSLASLVSFQPSLSADSPLARSSLFWTSLPLGFLFPPAAMRFLL